MVRLMASRQLTRVGRQRHSACLGLVAPRTAPSQHGAADGAQREQRAYRRAHPLAFGCSRPLGCSRTLGWGRGLCRGGGRAAWLRCHCVRGRGRGRGGGVLVVEEVDEDVRGADGQLVHLPYE
eukprot:scaffold11127_cov55-Phaeocystis_antarctica.AAC.1